MAWCLMTVWKGGSECVPAGIIETEMLALGISEPKAFTSSERQRVLPSQRLPLCAVASRICLMKAASNKHLKSSIQKITKSWPFIPLKPSHRNENMYLAGETLALTLPGLCSFSSLFHWGLKTLWFISALHSTVVNCRLQSSKPEGSRVRSTPPPSPSLAFCLQPALFVLWLFWSLLITVAKQRKLSFCILS